MPEPASLLAALAAHPGQSAVLATLVQVEGSFYRRPGARMLIIAGERHGSISAGCLEEDLMLRASRVRATGRAEVATYDTTQEIDLVWGVGLGCQSVVRILLEPIAPSRPEWLRALAENQRHRRPTDLLVVHAGPPDAWGTRLAGAATPGWCETIAAPPALVIFGAGDDAQPLARMAKETGWHLTVADARAAYAIPARFPAADRVVAQPADRALTLVHPGASAVIMTHRFSDDATLLRILLPQPLAYLGLLGPRQRADRLLARLHAEGFTPDAAMLARLHAPVGLDLGGSAPEAVALSIVAELQCHRHERSAQALRTRPGPIHA
jgi:xanthine/CO dehydrogenase XdhC/CoxF family maturation factor